MTRAVVTRRGSRCRLALTGHAEGRPEVCAALSLLLFALAGWVRAQPGAQILEERLEPGEALLCYRAGKAGRVALAVAEAGLRLMAEGFPEQVTLKAEKPERRTHGRKHMHRNPR